MDNYYFENKNIGFLSFHADYIFKSMTVISELLGEANLAIKHKY